MVWVMVVVRTGAGAQDSVTITVGTGAALVGAGGGTGAEVGAGASVGAGAGAVEGALLGSSMPSWSAQVWGSSPWIQLDQYGYVCLGTGRMSTYLGAALSSTETEGARGAGI